LYYYAGLTYSSSGGAVGEDLEKLKKTSKDQAAIDALQAKKNDYFEKAVEMYKKALELDPNYVEANVNIGSALVAPAIDMYNDANQLPPSKQKEYNVLMAKATAQFEVAKPYLLKAVELDPKSRGALTNLKNYYMVTKDMAKVTETQKKINALGGE
ncbi:MAG TPA: tetratricopeptide repeat protein, partial [Mucilaginibacter sp.]